jgi:hypothetical protein
VPDRVVVFLDWQNVYRVYQQIADVTEYSKGT